MQDVFVFSDFKNSFCIVNNLEVRGFSSRQYISFLLKKLLFISGAMLQKLIEEKDMSKEGKEEEKGRY